MTRRARIVPATAPLWPATRPPYRRGRVRLDLDRTVNALRAAGRLDDTDRAAVALARTTAGAIDRLELDPARSEHVLASVARVHLAVLVYLGQRDASLSGAAIDGGPTVDEELAGLLADLTRLAPGGES